MAVVAGVAHEEHQAGVAALAAGRPEDAAEHLRRALAAIDGADAPDRDSAVLRVRVLITLASLVFEVDGLPAARQLLDRAESEARPIDTSAELLGLCHSQHAHVLGRSGRMADALAQLEAAGSYLEAMAPRDRWVVLVNRGVTHSQCGDLDRAESDLAAAADLAARTGLGDEQRMAEHNLGWVRFLRGDLPGALTAMVTGGDSEDDGPAPAVVLLDHGRVLLEAGLLAEAVRTLERGRELCRRHGMGHVELETTVELARAHEARGAPDRSAQLLREAAASSDVRGASGWADWCALLAARHDLASDPGSALTRAEEIAAGAADDPGLAHRAHLVAAEAAIGAGAPDAARRHLLAVGDLAGSGPRPSLSSRLEHARVAAVAARAAGDDEEARRVLGEAADDLASSAASVTSLDLRTARAVHAAQLAAADLALARDSGPEAVFEAAERWRGRGSRLPAARPHPSRKVADLLAEVRRTAERQRLGADPEERARLATLERTAAAAARAAAGGPVGSADEPVTPGLERLRVALRDEEADLLTLVEQDGDLWAVGLVGGAVRARRLGARSGLEELARRVRVDLAVVASHALGPLAAAVTASLEHGVAALREQVLDGFGTSADRLVVVPTAGLADLPWTLVAGGRPVTVAPSATAWWHARARLRSSPRAERGVELAVVTGPRLAQAGAEAEAVRAAWGPRPELVEVGDGAALRRALRGADVVHVGAHGRHHPENPMFSSVSLTDGPTFLYDLESDGVAAGHVVLAACDTGRVEVRPGEEPLGLAVGMLALGAACVVAAAAPVPDDLVAEVMPAYHRGLALGAPADVALADALRDRPVAAGAFVVTGTAWSR